MRMTFIFAFPGFTGHANVFTRAIASGRPISIDYADVACGLLYSRRKSEVSYVLEIIAGRVDSRRHAAG